MFLSWHVKTDRATIAGRKCSAVRGIESCVRVILLSMLLGDPVSWFNVSVYENITADQSMSFAGTEAQKISKRRSSRAIELLIQSFDVHFVERFPVRKY